MKDLRFKFFNDKFQRYCLTLILLATFGCQNAEQPTFSLLPGEHVFQQNKVINNKIDILWVIDNSGSMNNLQNELANNFSAFINDFVTKNFDYKIAVTTTDAWTASSIPDASMAKVRDGDGATSSGVFYITPDTPDPVGTFVVNVKQGVSGNGDERPFQSMKETLESPLNSDFRRSDAFLAVIIVTDEDDFSANTFDYINEDYGHAQIHSVQSYVDFLDNLTNSSVGNQRYSVSGITITESTCLAENNPWGNIAQRVHSIVDATNGVVGDVCSDNFSQTLNDIQLKINELATQFRIERDLYPETLEVVVDGVTLSENTQNGWSYTVDTKVLSFHGDAVPEQGAEIKVHYEPVTIK